MCIDVHDVIVSRLIIVSCSMSFCSYCDGALPCSIQLTCADGSLCCLWLLAQFLFMLGQA